jgi:hypothetical protein
MGFISNVHKYWLLRPTRSASFLSFDYPSGDPELRLLAQPPLIVTPISTNRYRDCGVILGLVEQCLEVL